VATSTNLLTMCSLDCLSHEVNLLRPVNDATLIAPPTSLQFLVDTSLDSNKSCSFDCSPISLVRYATNSTLAYSIVGKHPWLVTSVLGFSKCSKEWMFRNNSCKIQCLLP
jgi:hypothetical protein